MLCAPWVSPHEEPAWGSHSTRDGPVPSSQHPLPMPMGLSSFNSALNEAGGLQGQLQEGAGFWLPIQAVRVPPQGGAGGVWGASPPAPRPRADPSPPALVCRGWRLWSADCR